VTHEPPPPISWPLARDAAHAAGRGCPRGQVEVPLAEADGLTLAAPLVPLVDLPSFPTSSVDGWAVRGDGPWKIVGRVLAGDRAEPLRGDGTCVEIATGAMVPAGTRTIIRLEHATVRDELVSGVPRDRREWRQPGEEATRGELLCPAGTPVDPGVIGLAAACGHDVLPVWPAMPTAILVFGDELRVAGPPVDGRIRDALGPCLPAWVRRLGAQPIPGFAPMGPVADTLAAHIDAVRAAVDAGAQLIVTTGGTMRGPVDHVRATLAELGARYVVDTVAVRPGYPMILAELGGGRFLAALPGNPHSAVIALMSLVAPLLAGAAGRPLPALSTLRLAEDVAGMPDNTRLVLVDRDGQPARHTGSAMLRGLTRATGFAVVPPDETVRAGAEVSVLPLPLLDWERP
jgi:molybdopterin molybdotransferase